MVSAPQTSLAKQQHDIANYVAGMILELRDIAKAANLDALMVPLEKAYYAAFSAENPLHAPPSEVKRINRLSKALEEIEMEIQRDGDRSRLLTGDLRSSEGELGPARTKEVPE